METSWVLLLITMGHFSLGYSTSLSAESQLIKSIRESYDELARPNTTGPTEVNATLTLYQLLSVDDRKEEISFTGGLLLSWKDEHLRWVPSSHGGIYMISLPGNLIWRPDIGLASGTEKAFDFSGILQTSRVTIAASGDVFWHVVRVFRSTCGLNMQYFPFDVQTCQISFFSQTMIQTQVKLFPQSVNTDPDYYKQSDEWFLVNAMANESSLENPIYRGQQDGGKYDISRMDVYLKFSRRSGYYWINIIGPCMLISLLVTGVFAMPSDAGEKISFSVTILLAFTVYQLLVAETLPKTSDITPFLSMYLFMLIGFSAMSVAASLLVLNVHHRDPSTKMPKWFHALVFRFLALITCSCSKSKQLQTGMNVNDERFPRNLYDELKSSLPALTRSSATDNPSHSELIAIRELLGASYMYQQNVREKDEQKEEINEWKLAAAIIDRFFLILYLVLIVVVTMVLILPAVIQHN